MRYNFNLTLFLLNLEKTLYRSTMMMYDDCLFANLVDANSLSY